MLRVRRERFSLIRSLAAYQQLRQAAESAGLWHAERCAALEMLRADAVGGRARQQMWRTTVWVDALHDGDTDEAWQAATVVPAGDEQWLRLADAVAPTRPSDALAVYLRLIETLKSQTGDSVYQQIARLLAAARTCWRRLDRADECAAYITALRTDQKRKRNLMRTLDQHNL